MIAIEGIIQDNALWRRWRAMFAVLTELQRTTKRFQADTTLGIVYYEFARLMVQFGVEKAPRSRTDDEKYLIKRLRTRYQTSEACFSIAYHMDFRYRDCTAVVFEDDMERFWDFVNQKFFEGMLKFPYKTQGTR